MSEKLTEQSDYVGRLDESNDVIIAEADLHMSIGYTDGACTCVCISDCSCNPCLLK
jgi:hypothetical protein